MQVKWYERAIQNMTLSSSLNGDEMEKSSVWWCQVACLGLIEHNRSRTGPMRFGGRAVPLASCHRRGRELVLLLLQFFFMDQYHWWGRDRVAILDMPVFHVNGTSSQSTQHVCELITKVPTLRNPDYHVKASTNTSCSLQVCACRCRNWVVQRSQCVCVCVCEYVCLPLSLGHFRIRLGSGVT